MSELIDLFKELVLIPSPSMHEEKVADKICEILKEADIEVSKDDFGNVHGKILANDNSKKSLMLSAHMDVVGDKSPIVLKESDNIIETDKTRTLGADDKAGVASAISLAKWLKKNPDIKHGGLELLFTRDEEMNMSGAKHVDFNKVDSEYVIVMDADRLGDFQIAGAGFIRLTLRVQNTKGGHSGIDIDDTSRINAVKVLSEIMSEIPQGVYYKNETGVVTSINAGVVVGGGVKNIETNKQGSAFMDELLEQGMCNIINTDAYALYSIRSSDKKKEAELLDEIKTIQTKFQQKYKGLADIVVECTETMKPFEKSSDETLINVARKAGENLGIKMNITSFHAGAETHHYAHQKNKFGKILKPVLMGAGNVYNMHSAKEYVEKDSMEKAFVLLKEIFTLFNK
ncbi:MAG: M20/M25/M40 family metallo-hydrolase [Alphaproteobacteria bacterium]|nr:M20/M25/M40 family metallo-hydrolase [Alphaproteobacteria bacterium]